MAGPRGSPRNLLKRMPPAQKRTLLSRGSRVRGAAGAPLDSARAESGASLVAGHSTRFARSWQAIRVAPLKRAHSCAQAGYGGIARECLCLARSSGGAKAGRACHFTTSACAPPALV